jgi:hypothetical protein
MDTLAKKGVFSVQTRNNILLDMQLGISGLLSGISGIYFLFLPVGGYQGGRNPYYGITILFDRHTWSDIHTWVSVAMISVALLHITVHWEWIVKMTKNGIRSMVGIKKLNRYSQFNLMVNILIGVSGLICGLSGLYFLFFPGASHAALYSDPGLIFNSTTWDMIHTWSGTVMVLAAVLHFTIHWKWVVKVISKYWKVLLDRISPQPSDRRISPVSIREIQ